MRRSRILTFAFVRPAVGVWAAAGVWMLMGLDLIRSAIAVLIETDLSFTAVVAGRVDHQNPSFRVL